MPPLRKSPKTSSTPQSIPRASIPNSNHKSIDTIFKSLRSCTRKISECATTFGEEMHILERLCYKAHNQHKGAMFWRKVVETRRVGRRVREVELDGLGRGVVGSFEGVESLRKGWSRAPMPGSLTGVIRRCSEIRQLFQHAREVHRKTYHALTLQLRTGAFTQLTLAFIALVSRLDTLVSEMDSALGTMVVGLEHHIQIMELPIVEGGRNEGARVETSNLKSADDKGPLRPATHPESTASSYHEVAVVDAVSCNPVVTTPDQGLLPNIARNEGGRKSGKKKPKKREEDADEIDEIFGML